jgi:CheY-like chemotaxis protein
MGDERTTAKHVLVVDDEPDFAALLRSILVKAGYTVATAYDCEDALAQVRKHRPDIITLDIHMPRKSGVFFYRKLKANAAFRDVPVVVVTALTRQDREMESLIRSLLEPENVPHPQAYLEKPIDAQRLLQTIEEALASGISGNR